MVRIRCLWCVIVHSSSLSYTSVFLIWDINTFHTITGKFEYDKILFVSPLADPNLSLPNRIDAPYCTVYDAIQYLTSIPVTGWTIWVLAGEYYEKDPWAFSSDITNTTIKLEAGTKITSDYSGYLIQLTDSSVSLAGDSPALFNDNGCKIEDTGVGLSGILLIGTSVFNMENVYLETTSNNIGGQNFNGKLFMTNSVLLGENNFKEEVGSGLVSTQTISIRNSYLHTKNTGSANSNIICVNSPGIVTYRMNVVNSRLYIGGTASGSTGAHIQVHTGSTGSIHLTLSDLTCYSNYSSEEIFYDQGSTTALVDIIAPIASNAGSYGLLSQSGSVTNTTSGTVSYGCTGMQDISNFRR